MRVTSERRRRLRLLQERTYCRKHHTEHGQEDVAHAALDSGNVDRGERLTLTDDDDVELHPNPM